MSIRSPGYAETDLAGLNERPVRVTTRFVSNVAGSLAFVDALKWASGKFDDRLDDGYRVDLLGIPFHDARVKRTPWG